MPHGVAPQKQKRESVIVLKNRGRGDRPLLLPGKQNLLTRTPHVDPVQEHPTPTPVPPLVERARNGQVLKPVQGPVRAYSFQFFFP